MIHLKRKAADKLSNFVSHMRSGFGYVPLLPTLDQLIFTEAGKRKPDNEVGSSMLICPYVPHLPSFRGLNVTTLSKNYQLLTTATSLKRLITGTGKRPSDYRRCLRNWLSHRINIPTICCMIALIIMLIFWAAFALGHHE